LFKALEYFSLVELTSIEEVDAVAGHGVSVPVACIDLALGEVVDAVALALGVMGLPQVLAAVFLEGLGVVLGGAADLLEAVLHLEEFLVS